MAHSTTARLRHQIFRLNQPEQPDLDFGLGEILPPEDLALILTEEGATWKTIIYTPWLTTWAFLWQMLSPDRSCRAAVKRIAAWLSSQGKKLANDKDDPYIKARQRLPETVPLRLMKHIGRRCHERAEAAWRWCDRTVKSVDGSMVSMSDTSANQAEYPQSRSQAPGLGFPLARLVVVFCLATGVVLESAIGPARGKKTGENTLFRSLWDSLDPGDVVLADRCYCSYFDIAMLKRRGIDVVFRLHQQRRCDFRCGRRLGREDQIVSWTRPKRPAWMDEATYEQIPETLEVRQLRVRVETRGFRTRVVDVVTTLLDAEIYTKAQNCILIPSKVACGTRPALDQGRPGHGRAAVQDPGDGPQRDRHDAGGVQRDPGVDGAGGEGARPGATSIELQGSVAVALGVRREVEGELGREARLVVGDHSGGYR